MRNCQFCGAPLSQVFADLGHQPPSNSFLTEEQLNLPEVSYPLKVFVCSACWLVQIPETKRASDIFNDDYVYYSSQSPANVSHAKKYVEMMCRRFGYGPGKHIFEIGSNDGYLLQWFQAAGCFVQGIDPADGPRQIAEERGIPTLHGFFDSKTASALSMKFDLICGINVLAHQPHINDFVKGMKIALAPEGIITHEFPHLMRLVEGCQFDTIYHEHYSYFSLMTVCEIFARHGLEIFDVDEIPEHGGSLRIYAQHRDTGIHKLHHHVPILLSKEIDKGMNRLAYYQNFSQRVKKIKADLMAFLIDCAKNGRTVAGYGAPAKANTLLGYCGIKSDLLPFTVDRSPYKQNKYLPGSHIRVTDGEELKRYKPDYVIILPWNLKEEIMAQLSYIREWNGKFVVAIPRLGVL